MHWNTLWLTSREYRKRERERKLVWGEYHRNLERQLKAEKEIAKERAALMKQQALEDRAHRRDLMNAKIDRKGLSDEAAELEVLRHKVWKDHLKAKAQHITFIDWTNRSHLLASVEYVASTQDPFLKKIFDANMAKRRIFERCERCVLVQKLAYQNKLKMREKRAMEVFCYRHTIPCVREHTNKINTDVLDLPEREFRENPWPAILAPLMWIIHPHVDPPPQEWQSQTPISDEEVVKESGVFGGHEPQKRISFVESNEGTESVVSDESSARTEDIIADHKPKEPVGSEESSGKTESVTADQSNQEPKDSQNI